MLFGGYMSHRVNGSDVPDLKQEIWRLHCPTLRWTKLVTTGNYNHQGEGDKQVISTLVKKGDAKISLRGREGAIVIVIFKRLGYRLSKYIFLQECSHCQQQVVQ